MNVSFHAACLLFPRLPANELEALAADIRANGLINPIVTLNGQILDGRNRLAACKLASVPPRFVEWSGTGSPIEWVVATNLMRRHLTASQRAAIAFELLPMMELEAKERQRRSPGRGRKGASALATFAGKASQVAARMASSNSAYVEKLKAISRQAPEILPEIKAGRVTVLEGVRLARIEPHQRNRVLAEVKAETGEPVKRLIRKVLIGSAGVPASPDSTSPPRIDIWCGDCLELMKERITDGSISVVVTSPPYNVGIRYRSYHDARSEPEYLQWMERVFIEIERVLSADGSFFLVIGHTPKKPWTATKVAEAAGKHFRLQNHIIWVKSITLGKETAGHFSPVKGNRFLNHNWESILHFSKVGRAPIDRHALGVPYQCPENTARTGKSLRCGGDVWFIPYTTVHGTEDRAHHPASFPPEISERCIKLIGLNPKMTVLDPFCGVNGMIGPARLGVHGIGIDIDPVYCASAKNLLRQSC